MPTKVIVTKPSYDAAGLIEELQNAEFLVEHLPVFEIFAVDFVFDDLIIDKKTKIFFSSPTAINLSVKFITELTDVEIIVPGGVSAARVRQFNQKIKISYPEYNYGVAGVIASGLIKENDKLVIFGGNIVNSELASYCKRHNVITKFLKLYSLVNIFDDKTNQMIDLINTSRCYLIVSSSSIAKILVDKLKVIESIVLKQNLIVISLHDKITKVFQSEYDVEIIEVLDMINNSIVNKLISLEKRK